MTNPPSVDNNQRIAKLVRLLQETELELQVLTGGQLDAITLPSGDPLQMHAAQEKLRAAEATQMSTAETQIAILNALPAHIALLDAQGVILTFNESWRSFASANILQSADFFVGQNYLAVCEQASGECAEEAQDAAKGIRRVLSGETAMFALEYPCHSLTEQRWFRLMVTPLSLGPVAGAVVMHVNVTERRLAEEDLRQNKQQVEEEARRLRESQSVAHVGSWETDLTTLAVTWTGETHRIFGTNPDEFIPTHPAFLSFVHPDDRAQVNAAFAKSQQGGAAFSIEHRICLADGTIKYVEERWQAFNDDAGRPVRAVGTCQDITTRKLADEVLRMRAQQQEVIARIGFESMRATTLDGFFDFTTHVVAEALGVEMCKVLQLTPDGSRVRLVSGVGWQPGLIGVAMVDVDVASQAGFTLKSDGPIFVNDLRKETRFQAPPLLTQHNVLSGLSVTIPLLDKPWGVLGAHCRSVRNFDAQDAQFMQSVAALLAVVIERLAAQRSVSESERRMRDAQRIAHLGNWELAIAPNRLMWSDEAYRIFGVTPETFVGTYEAFLELVHPEDRQAMDAAHRKVLSGEGILEIDHRILLPDGEIRHLRERAELIRNEAHLPVVLSGTVMDITESVLAQKAQREAEERNSAIVASALDGIITIDHENRILEFNPSAESIFGWTKTAVLGRDMSEVIIPERMREGHRRGLARYLESGEKRVLDRRLELSAIRADGTEILIELNATRLGQTSPPQFTAFIRDITQQKRAEQALTETQERYRSLVESSHDVIYTVSPEGQILFINEASRSVLGYAPEELVGRHWVDIIPADRRKQDLAVFAKIIKSGDGHTDYLAHVLHKDGSTVVIRANSRSLLDNEGKLIGRTGTARDVTQSIRAEEALRESAERFRLMIEGSEQVVFYTHDKDHRFEYLAPSTLPVLGYEPDELLGQPYDVLLISGDPENDTVHEKTDQAMREGKPLPLYNIAVQHKNGGRIVLEIQESPIFRDGVVVGMQGFGRDITARKLAEDETRRSANLLQAVADSTSDAVFVKDLQGRYLLFNEGAAHLVGKPVAEVLGHDDTEIFDLEGARTIMESDREVMRSGQITVEEEDLTAAGVARIYHVTKAPYRDSQGKIIGLVGISRDITKRRQADELLRQNQTMQRIAGSAAKLGGWSIDLADNKLSWSDETAIIHDLEPGNTPTLEEAIAYYPPEHREAVSEHVRLIVTDGTPFDFEVELITARQRRIWVRAIGEAMRDNAGKIVRIYGAFQDITEQKQADLALIASNRALQLLSRCNEALIRSESEASLLHDICRIATEVGNFRLAWVGYAQDDAGKTIKPQAYSGEGHEYLTDLRVSWAEEEESGQGPGGRVIRSGKPLVIPDLAQEPSFALWLKKTKAHGFAGIVALPLKNQTRTFGVLILYTGEIHTPHVNEMRLLRELADDLAFGIGTLRSQADRRRMEVAIQKMAASVSASTNQNFFYQLATNMAEALGAQAAFVSRLLPGEPLTARTIAAVIDGELVKNFDYAISGTPCEALMSGNDCIVTERLAEQFPEASALKELGAEAYVGRRLLNADGETFGFLFALHRKPLEHSEFVSSTLQIFATRANAELERRKFDARLREQASLLDKARDAILVRNLDHTILYWNQSAERLYGWTAEEALGRSAINLFYRNTKDYLIAVESTLTTGEWQGELQQCTKAGALVAVEARWTLVRDDQGEPQSILCINTDITERKKLEQQFLRAQRMESIGTLAGGIAHDLNNVLAPIMMSIELLKIQEKNQRKLSVLNTIENSSRRGADMVKQVLSFARGVESQQLEVQAGHLLTEIEKLANETFLKNIQVRSTVPADLWIVRGDPTQLHQVLLNLCVNARDAMPYGGTLSLAASNLILDEQYAGMNIEAKPGPHVRIVVEDTGIGMPPEVIERIFEPFFTTKEFGKGTGLGLSTTIAIIKSHGGFLRVYSEVGVGTRFHVYLPAQTEPGAANKDNLQVELPGGQGQLILVIDDEASIRQITQQTLEAFGYRVVLASDGAEAAAIYGIRRHEIAAVLTDMMMPVMDGPATIQVLMRMNPQVRIIAASGLNANGMVAKAANVGVKHFIPKPYTAETLLKTLHTLLNETNATR